MNLNKTDGVDALAYASAVLSKDKPVDDLNPNLIKPVKRNRFLPFEIRTDESLPPNSIALCDECGAGGRHGTK